MAATSTYVKAQEQTDSTRFKAIGVDFTFINNFIPLENQIGRSSGYDLYYISSTGSNVFRNAFDLSFGFSKDEEQNDAPKVLRRFNFNYKIGVGNLKQLSSKFKLLYGFDFLMGYGYSKTTNPVPANFNQPADEAIFKRNEIRLGIGPFWGVNFNITKHLSLYTEMGYYVNGSRMKSSFYLTSDEDDVDEEKKLDISSGFALPTSLVLFYNF